MDVSNSTSIQDTIKPDLTVSISSEYSERCMKRFVESRQSGREYRGDKFSISLGCFVTMTILSIIYGVRPIIATAFFLISINWAGVTWITSNNLEEEQARLELVGCTGHSTDGAASNHHAECVEQAAGVKQIEREIYAKDFANNVGYFITLLIGLLLFFEITPILSIMILVISISWEAGSWLMHNNYAQRDYVISTTYCDRQYID